MIHRQIICPGEGMPAATQPDTIHNRLTNTPMSQGSETRIDTQNTWRVFFGKTHLKTHPKSNPVSFLVLLITKDFIMFNALEKL